MVSNVSLNDIAVVRDLTSGMESEPAFVWAQSRVELHSVTSVDLHLFLGLESHAWGIGKRNLLLPYHSPTQPRFCKFGTG